MQPYIAILIISAFIFLACFKFLWSNLGVTGRKIIALSILLVAMWNGIYAAELLNHNLKTKILLFSIKYVIIVYIPVLWLIATSEFTEKGEFPKYSKIVFFIIPTIAAVIILSNPYSNLFAYDFNIELKNGFNILTKKLGDWFWVDTAYNYLINIINMAILLRATLSKGYFARKQAIGIIIGISFPIFSNIISTLSMQLANGIDFTPVSFLFSVLITGFAVIQYGFMNIVPIAREYVFEDMDELMIVMDTNKKIIDINKKALNAFNTTSSNILGKPIKKISSEISNYDFSSLQNNPLKVQFKRNLYGREIYYYGSIKAIKSNSSEIIGYLLLLQDITQLTKVQNRLKKLNAKLYKESIMDGLTSLYNKKHITRLLSDEINAVAVTKKTLTIGIMDIDFFKKINDKYGHLVGDEVLKKVSKIIKSQAKGNIKIGRFGGEEFLIIMPGMALEAAAKLCNEIREKIEACEFEYKNLRVTTSIGLAEFKEDDINELIKIADDFLYKAKENGRNRIEF